MTCYTDNRYDYHQYQCYYLKNMFHWPNSTYRNPISNHWSLLNIFFKPDFNISRALFIKYFYCHLDLPFFYFTHFCNAIWRSCFLFWVKPLTVRTQIIIIFFYFVLFLFFNITVFWRVSRNKGWRVPLLSCILSSFWQIVLLQLEIYTETNAHLSVVHVKNILAGNYKDLGYKQILIHIHSYTFIET